MDVKKKKNKKADANVQRLVRIEMRLKEANDGLQERRRAEAQAQWATLHATSTNKESGLRIVRACDEELRLENEHLVNVRRDRLRELYLQDRLNWETELAEKGYAFSRD